MKDWKKLIEEAEADEAPARAALAEFVAETARLKDEAAYDLFGVKPGVRVVSCGDTFEVTRVSHFCFDLTQQPWLKGKVVKKDGTLGKIEREIFREWKLPTK